jgi:hypothetical protein
VVAFEGPGDPLSLKSRCGKRQGKRRGNRAGQLNHGLTARHVALPSLLPIKFPVLLSFEGLLITIRPSFFVFLNRVNLSLSLQVQLRLPLPLQLHVQPAHLIACAVQHTVSILSLIFPCLPFVHPTHAEPFSVLSRLFLSQSVCLSAFFSNPFCCQGSCIAFDLICSGTDEPLRQHMRLA